MVLGADPNGTLEFPKGTVSFGKGLARTLPTACVYPGVEEGEGVRERGTNLYLKSWLKEGPGEGGSKGGNVIIHLDTRKREGGWESYLPWNRKEDGNVHHTPQHGEEERGR